MISQMGREGREGGKRVRDEKRGGGKGGRERGRKIRKGVGREGGKLILLICYFSVLSAEAAKVEAVRSGELGKALELAKKEIDGERKKRMSLERECAVYQSQLEVRLNTLDQITL